MLVAKMHAIEVADRQRSAARRREAAHLLARELAHGRVTAKPGFL
jgi:hypothetical protein